MLSSPGSKGQRSGSPVTSPSRTARGFAYTGSAAGQTAAERRTSPTKRPDGQPLLPTQRSLSTRRWRRLLQARWWRPATLLPLAFGMLLLLISQLAPWDGGDAVLSYPDLTDDLPQKFGKVPPFVNLNGKVAPVFQHDATYLYLSGNLTFRKLPKRRDHPQGYVALCLAGRDIAVDLPEWINWHHLLGVDRFYVFDLGTRKPMNKTLQPLIDDGLVEYHYSAPGVVDRGQAHDGCLSEMKHRHAWLGFIDANEYIMIRNRTLDLPALLKGYETYGALAMSFVVFGTEGNKRRKKEGVLQAFQSCLPPDTTESERTKLLVNTRYTDRVMQDINAFEFHRGKYAVDETLAPLLRPSHPHVSQKIALHHYQLESPWTVKRRRSKQAFMRLKAIDAAASQQCTAAADVSSAPEFRTAKAFVDQARHENEAADKGLLPEDQMSFQQREGLYRQQRLRRQRAKTLSQG